MPDLSAVLTYAEACVATAHQVRTLFQTVPATTEKVAGEAFFCRCVDHFRAVTMLASQELDAEALALVRGLVETSFVLVALLKGVLKTENLEAFDRAARGRGARSLEDFLSRFASHDLQEQMRDYGARYGGPTLKFEELAKQIDWEDVYNGHYRLFSHWAAHPSMSSVAKYLDYDAPSTRVRYPGSGRSAQSTILIAVGALLHTCGAIEHFLGTTPEINQAVHARLLEHQVLWSASKRERP